MRRIHSYFPVQHDNSYCESTLQLDTTRTICSHWKVTLSATSGLVTPTILRNHTIVIIQCPKRTQCRRSLSNWVIQPDYTCSETPRHSNRKMDWNDSWHQRVLFKENTFSRPKTINSFWTQKATSEVKRSTVKLENKNDNCSLNYSPNSKIPWPIFYASFSLTAITGWNHYF